MTCAHAEPQVGRRRWHGHAQPTLFANICSPPSLLIAWKKVRYHDGLDKWRKSPKELYAEFEAKGADVVYAFQVISSAQRHLP